MKKQAAILAIAGLIAFPGCSSDGDDANPVVNAVASPVPNPIVSRAEGGLDQVPGGLRYDVAQYGYREQEYFFAGEAKTFPPSVLPPAPYRSRMIVWTPVDPARFNGTTIVEWAHVSDFGQFELTVELNLLSPLLEGAGYAFVLVSAEEDPERYGALEHPGDAYSFDIFSQALQAIKYPSGNAPLGELVSRFVIATGFQPSIDKWFPVGAPDPASFTTPLGIYGPLNAYLANGADQEARLADAFLIDAAAPAAEPPEYRVPTLHHLDESAIRRTPAPDSANHVTWEVIGAAHVDRWAGDHVRVPSSTPRAKLTRAEEEERRDRSDNFGQVPDAGGAVCSPGPTTGSQFPRRFTLNSALVGLQQWLETGIRPPAAPRAQRVGHIPESPSEKLSRDLDGNAIGGLRSPLIDVPIASYDGEGCVQAGTTVPLPVERLAVLYPNHESYVQQLLLATDEAVNNGFLLCQDAEIIMRKASASAIGGTDEFSAAPACAE
jgi:hypothetical protein